MNAIEYRREFHKYAETGWKEIRTSARIAEILENIGYENVLMGDDVVNKESIIKEVRLTDAEIDVEIKRAIDQGAKEEYVKRTNGYPGVIVEVLGNEPGETIAFRFDIDALPYEEHREGSKALTEGYISVNGNSVHACGHDGHTAIGLQLAEELYKIRENLSGKIRLIFQPAEETFSGAQSIVDKGYLDDVDKFVALHVALTAEGYPLPSNTIGCGASDFLSDCQLDVYYTGVAAHPCGSSQNGKNALLAACTAALNLHCIAQHEAGLFRINVGEIHGGVCANTIPSNAMMRLEYRGETPEIAAYGRERVYSIVKSAAEMYDVGCDIDDYGEIPAGKSDDEMISIVEKVAHKVQWFNKKIYPTCNVGGTDDATIMMGRVQRQGGKAVYIGIGTDIVGGIHSPDFDFDEECLDASVELCLGIIKEVLVKNEV